MQTKAKPNWSTHGLYGDIFFDVPVYRLTKEEFDSRQEKYAQKIMAEGGSFAEECTFVVQTLQNG